MFLLLKIKNFKQKKNFINNNHPQNKNKQINNFNLNVK